jgi:C-terminal processing protease CtpA/Prc
MKGILPHFAARISILTVFIALSANCSIARQHDSPRARAWLGVSIRDVTEKVAKENKLSDEAGAYVNEVSEKSPADSVGINEGDVIVEFAQKSINDVDELVKAVQKSKVGDKIDVVVIRKGDKKNFHVVLAKYPRRQRLSYGVENLGSHLRMMVSRGSQGMHLMELNDQLAEYFGAPNGAGILVEKVNEGSAADKAGIKAGDVLLKIGKRTIDDLEDVSKAFSKIDEGDKVDVEILRKGANKTIPFVVAEEEDAPMFDMFRHQGSDGEMFRMPRFEGNSFEIPRWNDQEYRFEIRDVGPNMKILRQKIEGMSKRLREDQKSPERSVQGIRMRTV